METREEFSTTCNLKVMARFLSVPDATSLHHCLQNHCQYFTILCWIQQLDSRGLSKRGFVSPFYIAIVKYFHAFPASWGIISHLLVLATQSWTVHNTKYLDPYHWSHINYICLFWRPWCRDVASGSDRHLAISFGLQLVESSSLVSVIFRENLTIPKSQEECHILV